MNKLTEQRIELLSKQVESMLLGFQLNPKEVVNYGDGIVDIPIFAIRVRLVNPIDVREDDGMRVIVIVDEEDITFDIFFWELAKQGFLHYLRNKLPHHSYIHFLERQDLAHRIIKVAMDSCAVTNPYKYKFCKQLLKEPLIKIIQENITIFDWLV